MPTIRLDIALYWISIIFLLTALFFQQSEVKYLQKDVIQLQALVKKIERVEVDHKTGEVSFAVKAQETKKTKRKDT
jgi:biopolymer transport protein ExbB/TolQ